MLDINGHRLTEEESDIEYGCLNCSVKVFTAGLVDHELANMQAYFNGACLANECGELKQTDIQPEALYSLPIMSHYDEDSTP